MFSWVGALAPKVRPVTVGSSLESKTLALPSIDYSQSDSPDSESLQKSVALEECKLIDSLASQLQPSALPIVVARIGRYRRTRSDRVELVELVRSRLWFGDAGYPPRAEIYFETDLPGSGLLFAADPLRSGNAIGMFGPPGRQFPILLRPVPPSQTETKLFLSDVGSDARANRLMRLDLRKWRYSMMVGRETSVMDLHRDEALIERLSQPGGISADTLSRVMRGRDTNRLGPIAALLLNLRTVVRDSISFEQPDLSRFMLQYELSPEHRGIPDMDMLSTFLYLPSTHFELKLPILSETWRVLAQIPLHRWRELDIQLDPAVHRAANWASTGGPYFSWSEPEATFRTQLSPTPISTHRALQVADQALIDLANEVALFLDEKPTINQLCEQYDWWNLTTLERRILNYLMASFPEGYFEQSSVPIEELARLLGIPLPSVAIAVNKLAGGNTETTEPPPQLPSPASNREQPSVAPQREYVYV